MRAFQLSEKDLFMLSDSSALLVPADNLLQQRAELYENALITAMRKLKKK